ncbi:hypothetical protein [Sulfuriferula multivorans]|uniref:hypothetical protein n=1 Tax=Sulfuriferula multivorans TaxID=1559896 RepID=UPI000F5BB82F|nr:hypothetical protein [Sulfuriferula multivorans]
MNEIEDALRIVEAAGFTVIDDRQTSAYYRQHEPRLEALLERAKEGDPLAAEKLLSYLELRPRHIAYSASLTKFMVFIIGALLSKRTITTATKPSKRLKNPLLSAVLRTDSRKDYYLDDRKRRLKNLVNTHKETETAKQFDRVRGKSQNDQLIEFIANTENLTLDSVVTR